MQLNSQYGGGLGGDQQDKIPPGINEPVAVAITGDD